MRQRSNSLLSPKTAENLRVPKTTLKIVRCVRVCSELVNGLEASFQIPSELRTNPQEHFNPLLEQISKLQYPLNNIQFEQHWLEVETERQQIVTDAMSKRTVHKALWESAAVIRVSVLQFHPLQRLFYRKRGMFQV